jgi:inosose dehydratase
VRDEAHTPGAGIPAPATLADAPERLARRIAAAPISWGACEVPGWGEMPDPETVLREMAQLGVRGTELGPPGFLPDDPARLSAELHAHGLRFVGAFTPLVLHEPDAEGALAAARAAARRLAAAGGEVFVAALVQDDDWSPPVELDRAGWRRLAERCTLVQTIAHEHGLRFALHPHVGTLVETSAQVERALEEMSVGWCLDTGHLTIGGTDPARFAAEHGERVTHVHLKDVDGELAARLRAGELSLLRATQLGLFRPLGQGVAHVADTLRGLARHGYDGWLVLEQDTAITAHEPAASAPRDDVAQSIAFLIDQAHTTEEERH